MPVLNLLKRACASAFIFLAFVAPAQSQPYLERPVSLNVKNQSLNDIFKLISTQTGVVFSYSQAFNEKRKVSISCKGKALRLVLNEILTGEPCKFKLRNKYIIIQCGEKQKHEAIKLNGYIYNARDSSAIEDASIYLRATKQAAVSDAFGFFSLSYPKEYGCIEMSVAKEGFVDTTFLLPKDVTRAVLLYLQPKPLPEREEPVNTSLISADSIIPPAKDTAIKQQNGFNRFWEELRKTNVNLQNISDTLFTDFSISLVPPISTNRFLSINTENKISFNLLIGYSKGVSVFELGGLLNIDNGNVKSVQIGGLGNLVSGSMAGVQVGGLFNLVNQQVQGVQIGGLFNLNAASCRGVQIGGIGNNNLGSTEGVQIGGIFNRTKNFKGFQLAGIANLSDTSSGFQLAGLINRAQTMKGAQLALINICDTAEGVPLGFFSFVRKGYHKLELSTDEIGFVSLSFGTGAASFHNVFSGGFNYRYPEIWTYGYGLGSTLVNGKSWGLNLDISAQQLQSIGTEIKANILTRVLLSAEFLVKPKFQIGLGPTLSFLTADTTDPRYQSVFQNIPPYSLYSSNSEGRANNLWIGAKVYIKFL